MQHRQAYLIENPLHNDRHWLREAFGYLRGLRATGRIFDQHSSVWRFNPRAGRHLGDRPDLRVGALPARRVRAAAGGE